LKNKPSISFVPDQRNYQKSGPHVSSILLFKLNDQYESAKQVSRIGSSGSKSLPIDWEKLDQSNRKALSIELAIAIPERNFTFGKRNCMI